MTMIFCESWDTGQHLIRGWAGSGTGNESIGAARTGNGVVTYRANGGYRRYFTSSYGPVIVGLAWRWTASNTSNQMPVGFYDGATTQLYLQHNAATASFSVVRGNGTVIASTSSGIVSLNTWYYLELKVAFSTTVGTYDLRVNGVSVLSGSGANTSNSGSTTVNGLAVGFIGANVTINQAIDDLVFMDTNGSTNNNFIGDVIIEALYPNGAGNYSQFTPSAGSNFQNVDESSYDSDTTYNSAAANTLRDSYTFTNIAAPATVFAVQQSTVARKATSGMRQYMQTARVSGTDYDTSAAVTPSLSSYTPAVNMLEQNPDTSTAWDQTSINAAEFGLKVTT